MHARKGEKTMCCKTKAEREQRLKEDLARIDHILSLTTIGEWYKEQITDRIKELYGQLEESIYAGKIMQDMLKEYMSAAEIKTEFEKRLIHVDVTLEGMNDGRTENA